MRYSFVAALAIGSSLVSAAPAADVQKRADFDAPPGGDVTILNYALTLEYLERKFYEDGLANYTREDFIAAGFPDPFYSNLKQIYSDEKIHVDLLSGALTAAGATPVNEAQYRFPSTDVRSFLAISNVLEGVGVSAYLGAAAAIVEKSYLTVAGSILTVEARHSSYIRSVLHQVPFPKAFDTPLNFNQVFSLAAQFITGFAPGDPALPFSAFPPLAIEPSRYPYTAGASPVTFTRAYRNALEKGLVEGPGTPVYAVLFSGLDTYYVRVRITRGNPPSDYKFDKIPTIPTGADSGLPPTGQVYVVLSTADGINSKVKDENTISGVGVLEVLPPRY